MFWACVHQFVSVLFFHTKCQLDNGGLSSMCHVTEMCLSNLFFHALLKFKSVKADIPYHAGKDKPLWLAK